MDAARFDFGEVCEQSGQKLVGTTYQLARAGQEVDVRDMLETESGLGALAHDDGAHAQQHTPRNFELLRGARTHEGGSA